jgi:DNA-binding MarR family transcriptional regulator
MTQSVGRMEREGLVVRLIDPEDARATLVDITAAGRVAAASTVSRVGPSSASAASAALCVTLVFRNRFRHLYGKKAD